MFALGIFDGEAYVTVDSSDCVALCSQAGS